MKKKLDILITRFPFQSQLGGEELHTLHLAQGLVERGHNVTLLTSDPVLCKLFRDNDLNVWKAGVVRPPVSLWTLIIFTLLSPLHFLYMNWYVLKFWRQSDRTRGKKVLYSLSFGEKLLMSPVAKLLGYNVVWVEHARIGGWLTKNPWVVIYWLWSSFSHVITPSKQTASPIKWARHLHVICHGVKFGGTKDGSSHKKKMGAHTRKKGEEFKVLCVARLSQDKGVDYAIKAVAKLISHDQKARLYIVGSGPLESDLKGLVKDLSIQKHVEFLGKMPHEELTKLYEKVDCLVLPSTQHDPFGLVVVEGMIMNLVTVCTTVCGVSEFVENGVESLVVPEKDEHALYQALNALLINQEFCQEIARLGHKAAQKKFFHERMVKNYEKVFAI